MNFLMNMVKDAIVQHTNDPNFNQGALLQHVEQLFTQHGPSIEQPQVRPASDDPYGDPGLGQYANIKPASQDPYGDPANQGRFPGVRPASDDPYGDPG